MANRLIDALKPKSRFGMAMVSFVLVSVAFLILLEIAGAGYRFGKFLRAEQEHEAAHDVRQGD